MEWVFLCGAILFEIYGSILLKLSEGMTKLLPFAGTVIAHTLCFGLLPLALKKIPLGIAYAVWCAGGIGAVSVLGIVLFRESVNSLKAVSVVLIAAGIVVGLNLSGGSH